MAAPFVMFIDDKNEKFRVCCLITKLRCNNNEIKYATRGLFVVYTYSYD